MAFKMHVLYREGLTGTSNGGRRLLVAARFGVDETFVIVFALIGIGVMIETASRRLAFPR
jgi:hypothetical protein